MTTDCHTHDLRRRDAIVCVEPSAFSPQPGIAYSIGIHPWHTEGKTDFSLLESACRHKQVVAIGETGIDRLHGADAETQEQTFIEHIRISEALSKPLIIHAVRSADRILALHKALRPQTAWIWHGFRGNAALMRQLTGKGIMLSIGEHFNANAVAAIPDSMLLIETDESTLSISDIAARIAATRHTSAKEIITLCSRNLTAKIGQMP